MSNETFERIEKKFWMTAEQYRQMKAVLDLHMETDQYGRSKIRNIYCDTDDYALIRRSIERPKFKEKMRIRSYAGFEKDPQVFFEIKRKVKGIGYKRRIQVSYEQAKKLLAGEMIDAPNPQIQKEIYEFVKRYHPQPKVYLTYERIALYGKENPDLRVTLDQNIRYQLYSENIRFEEEGSPVMEDETMVLMEVKAPGRIPLWLTEAMSAFHIYQAPFSKIGTCYTRRIAPQLHYGDCPRNIPVFVHSKASGAAFAVS